MPNEAPRQTLVISHRSAFEFWRSFTGKIARLRSLRSEAAMESSVRLTPQLREELRALGFTPSEKQPLDLLFSGSSARSRSSWVRAHALLDPLPNGALLQVSPHVAVVCPELCFLEMARQLSWEKLVLAGFELCSTYAQVGPELLLAERQPLTSVDAIRNFAYLLPRTYCAGALHALEYVQDGAASPMEAKVAMLLVLPTYRGGYALPRPALNHPIATTQQARRLYPRATVRPDMYWEAVGLDVEYDGRDSHDADDHAKDVARWGALAVMDIEVLMFTSAQVRDSRAFRELVQVVAGKIGHRPRIRREDFPAREARLREELNLR